MYGPLEGKTLLVTGATGFIGTHLVERLRRVPGAQLVLMSRRPRMPMHEKVTWVQCDCQHLTRSTWHAQGVSTIDYVFHLAAAAPRDAGTAGLEAVYQSNLSATRAVLDSLPSIPRRLVFASTLDVYAPVGAEEALSETTPMAPGGAYGVSKMQCEQVVESAARGYPHVVLRYGHIYGPGEQAYRKLIPETIRRLLHAEQPVVHGDGSALRDYLYVADAVEATIRAAVVEPAPTGPINIVRGESCTIRSVVEALVRITRSPREVHYLADRPNGHSLRFDNRKMCRALGQWPLVPLEEGLERETAYFRDMQRQESMS